MSSSVRSLLRHLKEKLDSFPIVPAIIFVMVALVGWVDASYLAVTRFTSGGPTCVLVEGCNVVDQSVYSTLFGIPISFFGVFFYVLVVALAFTSITKRDTRILFMGMALTPIAFIVSTVLVYIQLFILNEICVYCMLSAGTSTLLFMLSGAMFVKMRRRMLRDSDQSI